ncbi:MAG TPA: tetratricopeptide repeat protein, partial [Vicinamibacterales bacterium]|nr:tetratricopeptide repeat protein [Vicinamibacterales bacterium]
AAYELAEIHRGAGELEPARQLFEQAVAHHPAFEHAQIGLARTLIALDRPADALPHLKAALDLNPDSSVAYYHVARANRALGDTKAQQLALAQFNRTRTLAAERAAAVSQVKQDVTPQVLDAETPR